MRTVLVPTDFSARSLKLAEYVVRIYPEEIVDLILIYPYRLPLFDFEFYKISSSNIIAGLNNDEFTRTKDELVDKFYVNINTIKIELFIGMNSPAFQNFIDRHRIQTAVVPQKGFLDFSHNTTFSPLRLIKKNITEVHAIYIEKEDTKEPFPKWWMGIISSIKKVFEGFKGKHGQGVFRKGKILV